MWERSRWGCVFRGSSWPGCSWWSRLHGRESPDSLFLLVGFLFKRIYSTSLKIRSFVSSVFNFTDFGWFEHEQIRRWPRKKRISSRKKGEGKRNRNWQSCSCSKRHWVVPIYKKGDTDEPSNYRPTSLLNSLYKIYMILIRQRLQAVLETSLSKTQ